MQTQLKKSRKRMVQAAEGLAIFVVVAMLAAWPLVQNYYRVRLDYLQKEQLDRFDRQQLVLEQELEESLRDVRLLRSLKLYKVFSQELSQEGQETLRHFLPILLDSRKRYSKLQLIDRNGQEVLRVDMPDGKAFLVGDEGLQNASEAEYFRQGRLLPVDAVYIASGVEGESRAGQRAPIPVIHFVYPVADGQRNMLGVLVLSSRTEELVTRVWHNLAILPEGQAAIVSTSGLWVAHDNASLLWGNQGHNMKAEMPAVWQGITAAPSGRYDDGNGYYLFKHLMPQQVIDSSLTKNVGLVEEVALSASSELFDVIVYTYYSKKSLGKFSLFGQPIGKVIIGAFVFVVAFVFYVLLTYRRELKAQAAYEKALAEELADLYHNAPCGYFSTGPDLVITKANDTLCRWLGCSADDLVGKCKPSDLVKNIDPNLGSSLQTILLESGRIDNLQLRLQRKTGGEMPVLGNVLAIKDQHGRLKETRCTLHDYTERQLLQDRLQTLATTDSLTGLYLRRAFDEMAAKEFMRRARTGSHLCVMLIDVDHFKRVNDSYGHDAGDSVLKSLAQLLLNTVRQDDVVARYGGEEFAILMANTGIEEAQNIGRRIRVLAQSNPILLPSGASVGITVSIGLSAVKHEDQTIAAAMKRADIALYHAKGEGRNKLNVFLPEKTDGK